MADAFASQICSPSMARILSHDPRVMDFMDISADESSSHISDDDTSSDSSSMEAVV
jgi:hypothetical protein